MNSKPEDLSLCALIYRGKSGREEARLENACLSFGVCELCDNIYRVCISKMNRQLPASSKSLNNRNNPNSSSYSSSKSASIISLARLKNYKPNDGMLNKLLTSDRLVQPTSESVATQSSNSIRPDLERSSSIVRVASSSGKRFRRGNHASNTLRHQFN